MNPNPPRSNAAVIIAAEVLSCPVAGRIGCTGAALGGTVVGAIVVGAIVVGAIVVVVVVVGSGLQSLMSTDPLPCRTPTSNVTPAGRPEPGAAATAIANA